MEHTPPLQPPSTPPAPSPHYSILPLPPLPPGNLYQQGMLGYYEPRPHKPPVWTVFAVLAVTLILYVGVSIGVTFVYAGLHHQNDPGVEEDFRDAAVEMISEPAAVAILAVAAQLTFLAVTLIAAWLSPLGIIRRLRLGPSTMSWWGYLTLPVGMLSVNVLFESLVNLSQVKQEGGTLDMIHNVITQLSPGMLVVMVLVIGVMPGFAEEFLFRGYLQSRLAVRWGRGLAIFVAAALFGLFHFDRIQSPATFLMGLYLGYAAARAGSIRPSIFAHLFNNSAVVIISWIASRHATDDTTVTTTTTNPRAALLQAAGCFILVALCCLYLKFRVRPPQEARPEVPNHHPAFPRPSPLPAA